MKNISFTYRLGALFLTFLMFFSSIGLSMDVHFCDDGIRDISFLGKAEECAKVKKNEKPSHECCGEHTVKKTLKEKSSNHCKVGEGKCCYNESFVLQFVHDVNHANSLELANADLTFVSIFIYSHFYYLFESQTEIENYFNYSPPQISDDVIILHQVFLI